MNESSLDLSNAIKIHSLLILQTIQLRLVYQRTESIPFKMKFLHVIFPLSEQFKKRKISFVFCKMWWMLRACDAEKTLICSTKVKLFEFLTINPHRKLGLSSREKRERARKQMFCSLVAMWLRWRRAHDAVSVSYSTFPVSWIVLWVLSSAFLE